MKRDVKFARTKIIGTLGPASCLQGVLEGMIESGLDVVRLNCSHADKNTLEQAFVLIENASRSRGEPISILADLGGPKIRLGDLPEEIPVKRGRNIVLSSSSRPREGTIPAGYPELPTDVSPGNHILIDDGLVQLEVKSTNPPEITCEIMNDGVLKSRKGVNLPGVDISLSSITDKDREDIAYLVTKPVDYIALSFVRSRKDIVELKNILAQHGRKIPVVAKIEKPEAVADLEGIIDEADVIMVARGDLGVEMPTEQVPLIQKRVIIECNRRSTPVITATQMLDSMISNPRPTRAEASDVANAVFDGTDAVMLSGETSVGQYPIESVRIMDGIVRAAEDGRISKDLFRRRLGKTDPDQAICQAACQMAEENGAGALICLTSSGRTAILLSRFRSRVPIIAFTEKPEVMRFLNIVWGVQGEPISEVGDTDATLQKSAVLALKLGYVSPGDLVVYTAGIPLVESPHTNMVKIERLEG